MPHYVVCLGKFATESKIEVDLECNPRDRRLIVVRSDDDAVRRLRGLRGEEVLYVDMAASWYQRAFCRLRGFREGSIEEARATLAPETPTES